MTSSPDYATKPTVDVVKSIYHGCVSADVPSIVYGQVQPPAGTVTGSPALTSITVPSWKVKWYDAQAGLVATTEMDITATYTGPLPNVMAGAVTSSNPLFSLTGGTASRACPTSTRCTYYNSAAEVTTLVLRL
ncbi:hypothetical protein AB0G64_31430 [Streptomyces longwoodensis]|uniref:hypothetical protein n=1 Tax=Streptomyces longwoodensis TaxID=68231 RepID=UPI0033E40086